jgi:hypothetical protein
MQKAIMRHLTFPVLILGLLVGGCTSPKPALITYEDPFNGLRTDLLTDNLLASKEQDRELLYLDAARIFKSASKYEYYLEVTYAARAEVGYLDIGPGPSLVIVADGKELKFTGHGSKHLRKKNKEMLNETALYVAQSSDLRAIGQAHAVTVRVQGKNGLVQREFAPENLERFKKFATKFVPAEHPEGVKK